MEVLEKFINKVLFTVGNQDIKVITIITLAFIYFFTLLILWLIKRGLHTGRSSKKFDRSNAYSIFQIIRYLVWIVSISLMLKTLGISLTVLVAGSAAILVGIGLGLQNTFNDFLSGIIILIEGTTRIGDVLEIDGDVVIIQQIGIRTSKGLNRDEIVVIIPNSLITTKKVINWSHQSKKTRFRINVGVAYGSNVDLVIKILEESALEHPDITDKNLIEARLIDFGNSSLDFQVLFFSNNAFRIERVKSDIRKIINRKFAENNITIPFPQRDVHIINDKG
ncbi:MAG TPA: mechanosensitive ion channel domain-containing protein [Bacteroidales bacterium]|nr:mechanosensitive ion channel domain-containing protein [Bacteroidales bacterium]